MEIVGPSTVSGEEEEEKDEVDTMVHILHKSFATLLDILKSNCGQIDIAGEADDVDGDYFQKNLKLLEFIQINPILYHGQFNSLLHLYRNILHDILEPSTSTTTTVTSQIHSSDGDGNHRTMVKIDCNLSKICQLLHQILSKVPKAYQCTRDTRILFNYTLEKMLKYLAEKKPSSSSNSSKSKSKSSTTTTTKCILSCASKFIELLKPDNPLVIQTIEDFVDQTYFIGTLDGDNRGVQLFNMIFEQFKENDSIREKLLGKYFYDPPSTLSTLPAAGQGHLDKDDIRSNIPYFVSMVHHSNTKEKIEMITSLNFVQQIQEILLKDDSSCNNPKVLALLKKQALYSLQYYVTDFVVENKDAILEDLNKRAKDENQKVMMEKRSRILFEDGFWKDFFDLYEILGERQVHIIQPFLHKVQNLLKYINKNSDPGSTTSETENHKVDDYVTYLTVKWILIIIQKMINHDHRTVVNEGLAHFLRIQISPGLNGSSTLIWKFLKYNVLPVVNKKYGWIIVNGQIFFELSRKIAEFFHTNELEPSELNQVQNIFKVISKAEGSIPLLLASQALKYYLNRNQETQLPPSTAQNREKFKCILSSLNAFLDKKSTIEQKFLRRLFQVNLIEAFVYILKMKASCESCDLSCDSSGVKIFETIFLVFYPDTNLKSSKSSSKDNTNNSVVVLTEANIFLANIEMEVLPYWVNQIFLFIDKDCFWEELWGNVWVNIEKYVKYVVKKSNLLEVKGLVRFLFWNSTRQMDRVLLVLHKYFERHRVDLQVYETVIKSLLEIVRYDGEFWFNQSSNSIQLYSDMYSEFNLNTQVYEKIWFQTYELLLDIFGKYFESSNSNGNGKVYGTKEKTEIFNFITSILSELNYLNDFVQFSGNCEYYKYHKRIPSLKSTKFSEIYLYFSFNDSIPDKIFEQIIIPQTTPQAIKDILLCDIKSAENDLDCDSGIFVTKFYEMRCNLLRKILLFCKTEPEPNDGIFIACYDNIREHCDMLDSKGIISVLRFLNDTSQLYMKELQKKTDLVLLYMKFVEYLWKNVLGLRNTEDFWIGMKKFTRLIFMNIDIDLDNHLNRHLFKMYANMIINESEQIAGLADLFMDSFLENYNTISYQECIPLLLQVAQIGTSVKKNKPSFFIWNHLCNCMEMDEEMKDFPFNSLELNYFLFNDYPLPCSRRLLDIDERRSTKNIFTCNSKARFLATFSLINLNDQHLNSSLDFVTKRLFEINSSYAKLKCFENSAEHRNKTRIAQILLVLQPFLYQELAKEVYSNLLGLLELESPQPSIKYMYEWIIIRILIQYPELHSSFFKRSKCALAQRIGYGVHFSTICLHVIPHLSSVHDKIYFISTAMQQLFELMLSHHFATRLYAQICLTRIYQQMILVDPSLNEIQDKFAVIYNSIDSLVSGLYNSEGTYAKYLNVFTNLENDFYLSHFNPVEHYTLQVIFLYLPKVTRILSDEFFTEYELPVLVNKLKMSKCCESFINKFLEITNDDVVIEGAEDKLKNIYIEWEKAGCSYKAPTDNEREYVDEFPILNESKLTEADPTTTSASNLQKKVVPWKLLPINEGITDLPARLQDIKKKSDGLILVASLIEKTQNLGGLCRSCEIFGVSKLVIPSLKILKDTNFQSLSASSENWVEILEVSPKDLKTFLLSYSQNGYSILAVEQAVESVKLNDFNFPKKSVILLGNEKFGISPEYLQLVDNCIEIPQVSNIIRSLNVHVSGALAIWQYSIQHNLK